MYNILWIFSDQHRGQALGVCGDSNAKTPNLDSLAEEGIQFTNTYTVSPLCCPARASLYTGKYIHQHGVDSLHKPPKHELKMIQEVLQNTGYHTIHIGKWHLSGGAAPCHFVSPYFRPGWDEWIGWENSNQPFATEYSTGVHPLPMQVINGYQTDGATDIAMQKIEERSKEDMPWFLVLSVEPPHDPHIAPEKDSKIFEERKILYRENVPDNWKNIENENMIKGYYSQLWNLDRNIGRIICKLKETGQYDNTIIMYFSDHGDFMGSFGKTGKLFAECESSKIPFIVRHPDMHKRGVRCSEVTSILDITKTTLALTNNHEKLSIYGNDLTKLILNGDGKTKGWALIELNSFLCNEDDTYCYRAIVDEEYMYVLGKTSNNFKLYDMKKDEFQMHNLISDLKYQNILEKMHSKLIEILKEIQDPIYSVLNVSKESWNV